MTEKLIKLETAKLAKEKGFNWPVGETYSSKGLTQVYYKSIYEDMNGKRHEVTPNVYPNPPYYSAPTQALLQKWIREVHNIHITIDSYHCLGRSKPFGLSIDYLNESGKWTYADYRDDTDFEIYEDALEKGLVEGLKLINIKTNENRN
jgi:hypothetical protein